MTLLYAFVALAFVVSVPVALATVSREQGWRVVDQAWQLVTTGPHLLADGAAKWKEKVLYGFRSALRETKAQTCLRASAAFLSAFVALLSALTLFISFSSTLAGLQGTRELVVEVLASVNITPITLMSVEAVMACCYLLALLFDALGATDIFYLRTSRLSCKGWRKRAAARALLALVPIVGAVGSTYVVYQNGVLRESVVGKSGSESLLKSSGLSSGKRSLGQISSAESSSSRAPSNRASFSEGSSEQAAPTPESGTGDDLEWALFISTIGPSLLGFFAGAFAFANSIPVVAFLAAGACGLLWLPLVFVHAVAYVVTEISKQARSFMLSLFNLILDFRGKPSVNPGRSPLESSFLPGSDSLLGSDPQHEDPQHEDSPSTVDISKVQSESEKQAAPSENPGRREQASSGDPEKKTSGDGATRGSSSQEDGPQEDGPQESGLQEGDHGNSSRGNSHGSGFYGGTFRGDAIVGVAPSSIDPHVGRFFQPWWFKNPPSERPPNADDAEKTPGRFYFTPERAARISRAPGDRQKACVLELRLKENGGIDFLGRHKLPLGEPGKDA